MEKYMIPELDIMKLDVTDVITTSGGSDEPLPDRNNFEGDILK